MASPNVLLFVADQWRGDCLGIAGHPDVKTPFLDDLAEKGVRFTRAYSAVPSCIAARAGLLTGMSQEKHGRTGYKDGVAWRYPNTIAGSFHNGGYQTQCIGKMHVHPLRNSMGFDNIELHDGFLHYYRRADTPCFTHQLIADDYFYQMQGLGHKDPTDLGLDCNGWVARPWMYDEQLHPTHWVGDRTLDFLRRRDRDKPFFLMSSFVRPHPPFDAPESYFAMYRDRDLRHPLTGDWDPPLGGRFNGGVHGIADPELNRQAQAGYYACMTQVDHQIGRILEFLSTEGTLDNTIVMFVSDHGEMMGDHHLFRKALPFEGSAHIPMILRMPGVSGGHEVDEIMELRDVMPTLLEAAGLPVPDSCDGMSALCLLGPSYSWREALHGQHSYGELSNHYLVTRKDKYIVFPETGREMYFDMENDPNETHDCIGDAACAARIDALRRMLPTAL